MSDEDSVIDVAAHRPERDTEPVLTKAVVDFSTGDATFTRGLARALLSSTGAIEGPTGIHARRLLRHLPRTHITLSGEHPHPHLALRTLFYAIGTSRIDWLFTGNSGFALAVEVKINSRTGFQPRQIKRYSEVLRSEGYPYGGVLAVTVTPPLANDLLRPRNPRNLGYVTWTALEPALRNTPTSRGDDWTQLINRIMSRQSVHRVDAVVGAPTPVVPDDRDASATSVPQNETTQRLAAP